MNDQKLYFNGVNPRGEYLIPPRPIAEVVRRLLEEGWEAPPEWVLEWTKEHAVDDPKRQPILETKRPWDLTETGWGVVFAPDLPPRVRSELEGLLEHRRKQATPVRSNYFREIKYQGETTFKFVQRNGGKPGMMADPDFLPYYLLLVGSPASIPYKVQSELDVNHAVGRIYFDDVKDYGRYAQSVLKAEEQWRPRSRDVVFFGTEHENDPTTQQTARKLVQKLATSVLEPGMPWIVREVIGDPARKAQLRALLGGAETPALLFAACHGLGLEPDDDRQAACQGALVCQDWPGPNDEEGVDEKQWFAASDVPEKPALQGLVAFFYACHGLGTPQRDNFQQEGIGQPRPRASQALVSRLPQQLLSGGALAMIGHVDRAWAASLEGSPENEGIGAYRYGVRRLLQGHTVGWSMEYLNQSYAALAAMQGGMEEALHDREDADKELLAHLWLLRNDARNYMVFGDPAVRMQGAQEPR